LPQLAQHLPERRAEVAELHAAGHEQQQEPGAHEEDDHRAAPDVAIQGAFERVQLFQNL
jgi:hypothetical protein